jgi:phosphoglycolate phosphatase
VPPPPLPDLTGWTIAFDLDGTLVETAPDLVRTLNTVLAEQGLPPVPFETARNMVGRGAKALIEQGYAATGLPLSPDVSPRLFERFIEHYLAHIADESHPFDGCLETLDQLLDAGATLVVATNKRTDLATALLDALDMTNRFAAVVGADAAPAAKPDARHILFAIEEADGDPEMAIMVGDSATDVEGARNAGVPCAVMSFGYTAIPPHELGGTAVLDHYRDLPGWIAGYVSGR